MDQLESDILDTQRLVAASHSKRLAVLTHQLAIRQDEAHMETSMWKLFDNPLQWKRRLDKFARKGIEKDDVHHWIWILQADDTDTKVDRLVSSDRFVPIFVLMAILRSDEHMLKGSSLVKIYDYVAKTYIAPSLESRRAWKTEQNATGVWGRTLDSWNNMTPIVFSVFIRRIVHHCLRTFPSSLPMIARLVVRYIEMIPDCAITARKKRTGYANRCKVFNHALCSFRRTSPHAPLANLPYNWKALKILLGYSAGLRRPLVIDRWSYRSIRMVLMGLKKTEAENLAASRYAKSWPPYIRQLDGTDETRDKAQYLSRSVKAGLLKQSEGYSHDLVDHAIDNLGGSLPGMAVAIQTRSTPLGLWRFQHRSLQIFAYWAAKVKATRNAHEAWQVFKQPPMLGVKPDFQVYAEMFEKLFAIEVDDTSTALPGDAKETYPPHLANLTELESARITPCSAEELYEMMIRSGQKPVHKCLNVLIKNAPSLEKAAEILNESPLPKPAVQALTTSHTPRNTHLAQVPISTFNAYVALLCSRQGHRRWVPYKRHMPDAEVIERYSCLKRAVHLVRLRLARRRGPASSPGHTVMMALAAKSLVIRPWVSQAEDDLDGLISMIDLFDAHTETQGHHPVPFDCLCRCILKVLSSSLPAALDVDTVIDRNIKRQRIAAQARERVLVGFEKAKIAFAELIKPVQAPSDSRLNATGSLPSLQHELSASHIRTYLEVLAKVGDVDEGVRVMHWMLSLIGQEGTLEKARDPRHKQWSMLCEAIVAFRAFIEAHDIKPETMENIKQAFQDLEAKGGTWTWPTREEVEEYIQWREGKASQS